MCPLSRTGGACLLVGSLAGLASVLVERSVSLKAGDLASAFTGHPAATQTGLAVNAVGAVLLAGGLIWLAWRTFSRSPRLAVAGGVLGVLGLFAIVTDDAVHVAGSVVVNGLTAAQAMPLLDRLTSGGVVAAGVLSELLDLGVILLAIAALRIGVPRWGSALLVLGSIGEGVGFSAGSRYLAAAGFAFTFLGFATVVRAALAGAPAVSMPAVAQPA